MHNCITIVQDHHRQQRKIFIDGTLGGGGHTLHLLKQLNPNDVVFGCDVDADAINNTSKRLCKYMMNDTNYPTFIPIQCNFCNVHDFLQKHHSEYFQDTTTAIIDGILLDLGVSSYQIDTPNRGFTFMSNGPLDMRMSSNLTITAAHICNEFSKNDLSLIFQTYGDESRHLSNVIAGSIIQNRPLTTTNDLVNALLATNKIPKYSKRSKRHGLSSTSARIFQSLRIYVNKEDEVLKNALLSYPGLLKGGGRLVVLSYHSMEDRIVKHIMKYGTLDKKK
jgi:16S rRNA (cytosine1402-N4)-methyltransferase